MATRTARLNTLRGLLRELGVAIPVGSTKVAPAVMALLAEPKSAVPASLHSVLLDTCEEIAALERRIKSAERQLEGLSEEIPAVGYLRSIPRIGLLTATALAAFVGDVRGDSYLRCLLNLVRGSSCEPHT